MRKKNKTCFLICSAVIVWAVIFSHIHAIFAAEKLAVPTIAVNSDIYYLLDEILYLEGRGQPNINVQIQFQKQGAKPVKFNSKSDSSGEWVLAEKVSLEAGDWEVRARTAGENDIVSEWSNPRVIKVIVSGITIGGVNVKFAFLSLIIFILVICGISLALYFIWRVRRLKTALMGKEIQEARKSVQEGFQELRRNLLDELSLLDSSQKPFSSEEIQKKEYLLRDLENLERGMDREIRDIEEKM